MMRESAIRTVSFATALGSLAACDGGGGGGVTSISVPPPAPPPAYAAVNIFPAITTSTEFATLGYERTGNPTELPIGDGFSVRYDAPSNAYIFDLPSHAPGAFLASSSDASYWGGGLQNGSILWPPIGVLKPTSTNPVIQLNHTSFAYYLSAGPMEDLPHGVVAFGQATSASAVPITGSATMNAVISGISNAGNDTVAGTATLNFNFGAGTLSGQLDPVLYPYYGPNPYSLGTYTFNNTVFGIGSPTFSGNLTHSNPQLAGAFNGNFTGPSAQELMARWHATYFVPGVTHQPEQMFGVFVGKKCC
jgi:hypothetical protein